VTPAQCRAARELIDMSQMQLALAANVPHRVIINFEVSSFPLESAYLKVMQRALENAGVEFTEGEQPGTRVRK
jgi:hypothetical protein